MSSTPGARLRAAWADECVAVPGVFCPLVARLAESLGFRAVYLSGAALSASMGVPDIGLVTATEFAAAITHITASTPLPLLADADTGFGEALAVERTVRLYESAGAAGLHLEDQEMPKRCGHLSGKTLVSGEVMASKVRAAVAARRDRDFVVMARTDARGVDGMDAAISRARAYVAAGADAVFPEGLKSAEEFAAFAAAVPGVPLLANLTEFGVSPLVPREELRKMGYRLALYPVTTLRVAMKAAERVLLAIRDEGSQASRLGDMLTRRELYDLLGYDGYESRDKAYFG